MNPDNILWPLYRLFYFLNSLVGVVTLAVVLAIAVGVYLIISVYRPKDWGYIFNIVIMGDKDRWLQHRGTDLKFNFKDPDDESQEYEIKPTVVYEYEVGPIQRLKMNWRRINAMFLVVFRESKKEPVKYVAPSKSSYVLKTVEESTAIRKGLKAEFSEGLSTKTLFMVIVIIVVIVVVWAVLTGQVRM